MKKYSILILVLVLTVLTLAGCRNPNGPMDSATVPSTHPSTAPSTMPTEATSRPTEGIEGTTGDGDFTTPSGPSMPDTSAATDSTGAAGEGRARTMPGRR